MANHEFYMARALQLAERGLFTADPNPRVGCVIVKGDDIIGEGWHQRAGQGHAEVNAIAQAGEQTRGADCYVTLEPCSHFGRTPPCADALIKAGVKRVYIAMEDPNPLVAGRGVDKLIEAGIEVKVGFLAQQAEQLNIGFCQRMRKGKPYVRSKIAMSLDGRTAMASGESKWITSVDARQDVQKLRARSSAILTGINTVMADNPSLTVRPQGDWYHTDQQIRQPLRVVVDSQLKITAELNLLTDAHPTLVATTLKDKALDGADVVTLPTDNNQLDLEQLMIELAQRGINEVMVEAGAVLNGALLQAQLIDELVFYMAPKIMGNEAKGLFDLPSLQLMADTINLDINDIRSVGKDWRITAIPKYKES